MVNLYTKLEYTNNSVDFNTAINNANEFIKKNLTDNLIKQYLTTFVTKYAKRFVSIYQNLILFNIMEDNISLNSAKRVNGNIKIKFTYLRAITTNETFALFLSRNKGDEEIHNFVFENSSINAYINASLSNFVSFEIKIFTKTINF